MCVVVCEGCFSQGTSNGSVQMQEWFGKEQVLAKTCLDGAEVVLGGTDQSRAACKQRFNASTRCSAGSGGAGDGNRLATVRSAPPIATVSELQLLSELAKLPAKVYDLVTVKKDYAPVKQDVTKKLKPLKDLVEQLKLRTTNMDSRNKGWHDST